MAAVLASGPGAERTIRRRRFHADPPRRLRRPPPSSATARQPRCGGSGGRRRGRRTSPSPARAGPPPDPPPLRRLPADEITVHEGIPVTTVPRTIFDLAATSSADVVEFALREAESPPLRLPLPAGPPRPLSRPPRLPQGPPRPRPSRRNAPGRRPQPARGTLRPLPPPPPPSATPAQRLARGGGRRYQVDRLWLTRHGIIELDGWEGHRTRAAFREDRTRDRRLPAPGYGVTRIAWTQLDDEPETIASDLRALLGA